MKERQQRSGVANSVESERGDIDFGSVGPSDEEMSETDAYTTRDGRSIDSLFEDDDENNEISLF